MEEIRKLEEIIANMDIEIQEKDLEISQLKDRLEEIEELVNSLYRKF